MTKININGSVSDRKDSSSVRNIKPTARLFTRPVSAVMVSLMS